MLQICQKFTLKDVTTNNYIGLFIYNVLKLRVHPIFGGELQLLSSSLNIH